MANFIIIDDHPLARLAMRHMLEKEGHSVVAESGEGEGVDQLLSQNRVDALIVDIDLPGVNGIEMISLLRKSGVKLPAIVMSGKNADYYSVESMKAGANGFISKKNNLEDLLQAINAVFSGYGYFPLRMHQAYETSGPENDNERIQTLSKREFEVLKYLSEGKEIINIANRMKISNKTVSTYKTRLMEKLGLKNQRDILDFTRRNHIS